MSKRVAVAGRTAIVVDDGVATGATVRAALQAVRRAQPRKLVLAIPVAFAVTASLEALLLGSVLLIKLRRRMHS